jgi:hypothetical protein
MSKHDAKTAEVAVAKLARRLAEEPRLLAEIQRARRDFFGNKAGRADPGPAADASEHRFAEWFALERECDTLGGVPAELPRYAAEAQDLGGSLVGVFLVTVVTKVGVTGKDLQDGEAIDLRVPADSLRVGDLLVGRLYPAATGAFVPSTAASVFRPGAELAQAFQRDMQRIELERRLWQIEIEHLMLRRPDQAKSPTSDNEPPVPLEHLEADLERLLQTADSELSAAAISQQLADTARAGQVMGPLLDELAFDTDIDLDAVRKLLLQIWNAHHDEPPAAAAPTSEPDSHPGPPGETLGERLVRTLDEGLQQKRDVGELFAQLERMAGIEPDAAEDDLLAAGADGDDDEERDEIVAASDEDDGDGVAEADGDEFSGDLLPLVEEFLWETEQGERPMAATLRAFAALPGNAPVPHTDLEGLTAGDVMRFLLHVYLGAAADERARAVVAAHRCVTEFFGWAEATQEVALQPVLAACQGQLLEQVQRLETAGLLLSTAKQAGLRPGILQVDEVGPDGFGVRDDHGEDHWVGAPTPALRELRPGDLLLAAMQPGPKGRQLAGPVIVLPADARALME